MSILNILIYVLGGLIVLTYGFFAIRKYIKWKKRVKELYKQGQSIETAKANAYNDIYKKKSKKANSNDVKDIPFQE